MDANLIREFKTLEDAVKCAVENNATHIIQRYFVQDEYMGKTDSTEYDVDTVEDCMYSFFDSFDDAKAFQVAGAWSSIVGAHQTIVDVNAYLDYYGKQKPVNGEVKKLVLKNSSNNEVLPF